MGNGINKILPDLYLGNIKDARDRELLAQHNITHILSIHDTAAPVLEDMTYLCIPAADHSKQNLIQYFRESIAFIHESRMKGEGCLVHWQQQTFNHSSRSGFHFFCTLKQRLRIGAGSLTARVCACQRGRSVPQRHPGGGLHHDGDRTRVGGVPGGHQGRPAVRRSQPGLPAAAGGV
ncbi:uncharacterized protein LOC105932859 isoform X2 [Fundulus heteroclitus]|uniref:uncharacterized protein LOC105932859 isoform X2 n=1 Tax=Fundulus heteroclitus TaxID=8078 RepID=UPI00165C6DF9|nr:uncharacterized protein LOC105932859 isoform X2 [Fundulus heteroclitus]